RVGTGGRGAAVPGEGRRGEREGDELAALVLDAGAAVAHGAVRGRVAALEAQRGRCPPGGGDAVVAVGELVRVGEAGARDERDARGVVVGGEERVELGDGPPVAGEGVAQGAGDPHGVALGGRGRGEGVGGVVGEGGEPLVGRGAGDAAQDGVDELGAAGAGAGACEPDRLGDGGVLGHAHAEDLVGAEAQDVEDGGVEAVEGAVEAVREDRVVAAAQAQGAVGELGGEAGVAAADAALAQEGRQDEVGVGVGAVDLAQDVERDVARGVGALAAVGGCVRAAVGVAAGAGCAALASAGVAALVARGGRRVRRTRVRSGATVLAVVARTPVRLTAAGSVLTPSGGRTRVRTAVRALAAGASLAGARGAVATVVVASPGAHRAPSVPSTRSSASRAPRAQSAAGMCFFPTGANSPSCTACVAVPTSTSFLPARTWPGARSVT